MKNQTQKILISLIIIIAFLLIIIPANANIDNHKPVICFDCHTDGKYSYGAEDEKDECGGCHSFTDLANKMNLQALEDTHNPKTCKVCHQVKDEKSFHTLHVNVSGACSRCHGINGNAVPDKTITECAGCHGGQIHIIHQDKLTEACSTCHGSQPSSIPTGQTIVSTNKLTSGIYAKAVNYQQYTLLDIIKRLFGWT